MCYNSCNGLQLDSKYNEELHNNNNNKNSNDIDN